MTIVSPSNLWVIRPSRTTFSRSGQAWKKLGEIDELRGFFAKARSGRPPAPRARSATPELGLNPPKASLPIGVGSSRSPRPTSESPAAPSARPPPAPGARFESMGTAVQLDPAPAQGGRQSAGTIHHIAWGTTDAEQGKWVETLNAAGVRHSGIIDRHYFHSLYFREPGGVLFELATEEPGFTIDGPVEDFGKRIILPPWLESSRAQVEARLTPLPDPRAGWPQAI